MFYLIRHGTTKEALGILSVREVLEPDYEKAKDFDPMKIMGKVRAVVYRNIPHLQWYFDHISQAEYETYRDLHQFKVFT